MAIMSVKDTRASSSAQQATNHRAMAMLQDAWRKLLIDDILADLGFLDIV